jgi:hypothetical protein
MPVLSIIPNPGRISLGEMGDAALRMTCPVEKRFYMGSKPCTNADNRDRNSRR